jgi:metallophosphoesterase superfamily enzyme
MCSNGKEWNDRSMHIPFSDDVILDSRRAVVLPRQGTLVLADLFLGMGAARRKRPDLLPASQQNDIWERLLGLLGDYQPKRVVLRGDVKPNQGTLEDEEQQELRMLFRKLQSQGREVVQVVGHPERSWGPSLEGTGIQPVDSYRVGYNTLMHRRRIFVYPRHDPPQGFWINGGLHPLFAVPIVGADGMEEWLRYPAFLYTGFALVMPPFVSYAQGWEVMQPERLPRQARAWKVLGDHLVPLPLAELPPPPETLKNLARAQSKSRKKDANAADLDDVAAE